ncbi:MAG: polysaccharide deacetylase family protein [Ferruginibacter sp.]
MDPDSGGFSSSAIFKKALLTVSFSSFYFYQTGKNNLVYSGPVIRYDSSPVAKKAPPASPKKKKKVIYLSFDDGPQKGTGKVLAVLKEEQVPATMFLVGEHIYGSSYQSELYDSLKENELLQLSNHSYTHAFHNRFSSFYENADSAVADFKRCADSLALSNTIARTPGRNIWRTKTISSTDITASAATADSLQKNGFTVIGWDLEWHFDQHDRLVQTDSLMMKQVDSFFCKRQTKTRDHLVLLAHDRNFALPRDSARLHRFIKEMKKTDEYDFDTLNNYPAVVN